MKTQYALAFAFAFGLPAGEAAPPEPARGAVHGRKNPSAPFLDSLKFDCQTIRADPPDSQPGAPNKRRDVAARINACKEYQRRLKACLELATDEAAASCVQKAHEGDRPIKRRPDKVGELKDEPAPAPAK